MTQLDKSMHRIALASDRDHVTNLQTLVARLQSTDVDQGVKVVIVSASVVAQPKPGLTTAWAAVRVRLTDDYLSGTFGTQASATACYSLAFSYFGVRDQKRTACA